MASKEAFLATVRAALAKGNDGAEVTPPDASPNPADDQDIAQKAEALRESLAQRRDALLEQLHRSALLQEWKVVFVSSDAEAREAIVDIANGLAANTVVRTSHPVVERLGLDEALETKSIHSVLLGSQSNDMQGIAAGADIGITGMDYLIAETASASLVAREGAARMTSLLPPVHIAVAQADQVVETIEDLLIFREAELAEESDSNWYMNLISGPSKTADIEQTIVIGVHGPGEVHLVVIR
jgi:L-lactate dehydrogenase complex protein LldG